MATIKDKFLTVRTDEETKSSFKKKSKALIKAGKAKSANEIHEAALKKVSECSIDEYDIYYGQS